MTCSLSNQWMLGWPSRCFCCLSLRAQQVIHNQQNHYLQIWEFQRETPKPAFEESHLSNNWVTHGCCCELCPLEITSWAVVSVRVAGDLSHFSLKVLPPRHQWKTWSFAFFATGTLPSSLPNVLQQSRAMTHLLILALLWHEKFFQGHSPIWGFFPKIQPKSHLLCSLCWPMTGHSKSHFSQLRVHSDQHLSVP